MPALQKYNPDYHDAWGWSLAIKGATDEEIADAFGVSKRTIIRWKYEQGKDGKPLLDKDGEKILTQFGKRLLEGKAVADSKVVRSLFENCFDRKIEEKEEIVEVGPDQRPKPLKIRKTTKIVPSNVMAQMYWLNNRSKATGEWTQKQEVTVTRPKEELQDQLNSIAALINADDRPPRTIESIEAEIDRRGNE